MKILLLFLLLLSACTANVVKETKEGPFQVIRVVDGDTIDLANGDIIRFSGINTPEKGECYYKEAKEALTSLILGKVVYLVKDFTDKDKYERLLRYVYLDDLLTNSYMVEKGYAKVFDKYASTTKMYDFLKKLELQAQQSNLGVWSCKTEPSCLYIGSKNSKKYYPPACKYAARILPENKVCYNSEEEVKDLEKSTGCSYS